MKPFSNLLHRVPWWALLGGGLALFMALAVFVTPFRVLRLEHSGATPEENRAIKREIDLSFSEGAIDIGRSLVREMRNRTNDPARREELDRALEEIDTARETMREAGAEAMQAKRDAAEGAAAALKEAARSIEQAREQAGQALKDAGVEAQVQEQLDKSLAAAQKAQEDALKAERGAPPAPGAPVPPPPVAPAASPEAPGAVAPGVPGAVPPVPPARKRHFTLKRHGKDKGAIDIEIDGLDDVDKLAHPGMAIPPLPPLPPEVRQNIRDKVHGDMYRIGVGAALILLFIPLFILAIVSKFFIDRSRASQKMAEQKRREAEYHRMSQQVTEAKLSALQAQVEPHFLYNTLASVQALTEVDPQRANAMTGHLIQYLRNALPKMRESVSTVGQEIELVRAYLNILQMRMGKRLAFDIDVPAELMDAPFPPLMLPSLVENAIKHGLEPQREGGRVDITAECVDDRLRLVVTDTGRGFSEAPGQRRGPRQHPRAPCRALRRRGEAHARGQRAAGRARDHRGAARRHAPARGGAGRGRLGGHHRSADAARDAGASRDRGGAHARGHGHRRARVAQGPLLRLRRAGGRRRRARGPGHRRRDHGHPPGEHRRRRRWTGRRARWSARRASPSRSASSCSRSRSCWRWSTAWASCSWASPSSSRW